MKYLTNLSKKMNPAMKFLKKNHKSVLIVLLLLVLVFLVLRTVREKFEDTTLMSLNNAEWIEKEDYILDVNYDFVRISNIGGKGVTQLAHNNNLGKYGQACHTIEHKCVGNWVNPFARFGNGTYNQNIYDKNNLGDRTYTGSYFLQFDFGGEMRKVNGVSIYGRGRASNGHYFKNHIKKLKVTASIKEPKAFAEDSNDKKLKDGGDRYGFNFGMNTEEFFGRNENDEVLNDGEQWENGYLKGDNLIRKNDGSLDENVSLFTMVDLPHSPDELIFKPLYYIKFNKPVLCNAIRIDCLEWAEDSSGIKAGLIVDKDFEVNTADGTEIGKFLELYN